MTSDLPSPVWFNASGRTGEDLLNADQPLFVVASSNLSRDSQSTLFIGILAAPGQGRGTWSSSPQSPTGSVDRDSTLD
jgi:hypothetical protein